MKILIVYATKTGSTETCAKMLENDLSGQDVKLIDLTQRGDNSKLDPAEYDCVVIGAPVRMGKIHKKMRDFISENREGLVKSRLMCYYCCGFAGELDNYEETIYPKDITEHAECVTCFGGELRLDRQKGFDKIIVRMMRSSILGGGDNGDERKDIAIPTLAEPNIHHFADLIVGRN